MLKRADHFPRQLTVSVIWQLPASGSRGLPPVSAGPAQLQMTYAMTVVRQNGSWYVLSIGASPDQPGPPAAEEIDLRATA